MNFVRSKDAQIQLVRTSLNKQHKDCDIVLGGNYVNVHLVSHDFFSTR